MKRASTKSARKNVSGGILLYRWGVDGIEVLIAHPGGPFWAKRDAGAWSIPKGLVDAGEEALAAACREFEEETGLPPAGPFLELGEVRQKAGKVIHAWACKGDADPASLKSNVMRAEWPYKSGRWITFPEVDQYLWCDPQTAHEKLNPAQAEFVDRLIALLPSV
ncbi:MAG: NUDIX domain-containing protein [Acidobacteriota bacterium]|nr:NUDIX domain-containing protein [Acidobacteriota bacterium]